MKLALHVPINNLSLGQLSTLVLRTLFEREKVNKHNLDLCILPIGNSDISSQSVDQEFQTWIQSNVFKGIESYNRDIPVFKIWHLNQSLESYGHKQTLFSFYELDTPTKVELNIAKNNSNVIFSSKYSCDVFKMFGVNAHHVPLPFDSYNFKKIDKKFHNDERIVFNLCGKLEKRKHHAKVIKSWIKKYGNNSKYYLQCAIFNSFLTPEQNQQTIGQILGGEKPFNVGFYPNFKENSVYNEFLNSADIVLGMSGGEGWGLPEFQSVAVGKHAVILNAHAYKDWATQDNAVLVNPTGKIDSTDNIFFRKGELFNQGSIFDWNDDEFLNACDIAIARVNADRNNKNGLLLQEKFNKDKFVDEILKLSL